MISIYMSGVINCGYGHFIDGNKVIKLEATAASEVLQVATIYVLVFARSKIMSHVNVEGHKIY